MPSIFVGCPLRGTGLEGGTAQTVMSAQSGRNDVCYSFFSLSLLARAFNSLFVQAYTQGYDYFVLLHSDIMARAPKDSPYSWVELMVSRLQQLDAAVLSAVVPIKSDVGHTSLSLQLDRNNPYGQRRVTMKELARLPADVITREDVCRLFGADPQKAGAMLVNTGCWAQDLRNVDWAGKCWPGFGIDDVIGWSADGVPRPLTVPEDWRASQWLWEHDIPYYATREVVIGHIGAKVYENRGVYGAERDHAEPDPSLAEYEQMKVKGHHEAKKQPDAA